ncbi:MAG: ClpXP protease specificity-enhancing factor SspB [Alphaproteobacteria bacterium]|jgi:hypothetical protein|nr:ClpXP protease specificity-enhancing factor SspB [Alphaproteobacteria bacterium]MCV6599502.1 ClpXP protease specificity-enhancing factor SspB [Alphaproteobacteria bacterium]
MEEIEDLMGYGKMVEKSLKAVVRESLKKVEKDGLMGSHHFFITFKTNAKDVSISETLKNKYPDEMTIVLQHQFYDLQVDASQFSVTLGFNGVNETLVVPFNSIVVFADPSVEFVLQFQHLSEGEAEEIMGEAEINKASLLEEDNFKPAEIVSLDFKKKKVNK